MKEAIILHGTMVCMNHLGVLLTGNSGIGKSELSLNLIDRGHQLISDDATELFLHGKQLMGRSPQLIKNYLNVYGLGLLDIKKHYGNAALLDQTPLQLILHMTPEQIITNPLKPKKEQRSILGIDVPVIILPVKQTRNLTLWAERLVHNHRLQQQNYNATDDFYKNQSRMIQKEI